MNPNDRFIGLLLLSLSLHQRSNLIFLPGLWRKSLVADFFNRVSPNLLQDQDVIPIDPAMKISKVPLLPWSTW
jgi:hypothetical protein